MHGWVSSGTAHCKERKKDVKGKDIKRKDVKRKDVTRKERT
jgi:hypothetical protein